MQEMLNDINYIIIPLNFFFYSPVGMKYCPSHAFHKFSFSDRREKKI